MNPRESPKVFSLVRHSYGIKSSAALLKEVMDHAATTALEENLSLVAEMIQNTFVDDLIGSYDSENEVEKSCKRGYGRPLSFFLFNFLYKHVYTYILAYLNTCILAHLHTCIYVRTCILAYYLHDVVS